MSDFNPFKILDITLKNKLKKKKKQEIQKQYYQDNKDKIREQKKQYCQDNKDKIREQKKQYRKTEKGKFNIQQRGRKQSAKRRARLNINNNLTHNQWLYVLTKYNNSCAYCGSKDNLTQDHVIPLAKGGFHTKDNVVPACKKCNSTKGTKLWTPKVFCSISAVAQKDIYTYQTAYRAAKKVLYTTKSIT